ncbi:MAG: ORF6N domain-containing protein [Elusimicrobia bacterium]|nr:ORF6N domain-containing protein [Elusimicrobiota bacterium]
MTSNTLIPLESIERRIYLLRGHKVMLDSDLAALYGVGTRRLNEQVRRNLQRFPPDFMFRLTLEECRHLMSQIATSSSGWGGRRKLPLVFTQEGVAMLSGVLNSKRAIQVNIAIMRAFVRLREVLVTHKDLAKRLEDIERHLSGHDAELGMQAAKIRAVFRALRRLMDPPAKQKRQIGFLPHPSQK